MTPKKDRRQQRRTTKRKVQHASQSPGPQILHKRVQASERLKETQIIVNPPIVEPLKDSYGVKGRMVRVSEN